MNQPNKPKTLRNGNKESLIKDQESISSLSRRKQALINNFKLRAKDEKLRRSDYKSNRSNKYRKGEDVVSETGLSLEIIFGSSSPQNFEVFSNQQKKRRLKPLAQSLCIDGQNKSLRINQNLTHSCANKEEIQTKIYAQSIVSARNKVKYK